MLNNPINVKSGFSLFRVGLAILFVASVFSLNYRQLFGSKRTNWIRGTVELIDPSRQIVVLRCDDPARTHSLVWRQETVFANIDGHILPDTITPGQRVHIVFATERGQDVALRIEIEPVYEAQPPMLAQSNSVKTEPRPNG